MAIFLITIQVYLCVLLQGLGSSELSLLKICYHHNNFLAATFVNPVKMDALCIIQLQKEVISIKKNSQAVKKVCGLGGNNVKSKEVARKWL